MLYHHPRWIQDEGMKAEILRLRKKLSEQEKKLHSTVKRLHSTNQLKENMEKVIIDQCKCMPYYGSVFL